MCKNSITPWKLFLSKHLSELMSLILILTVCLFVGRLSSSVKYQMSYMLLGSGVNFFSTPRTPNNYIWKSLCITPIPFQSTLKFIASLINTWKYYEINPTDIPCDITGGDCLSRCCMYSIDATVIVGWILMCDYSMCSLCSGVLVATASPLHRHSVPCRQNK